MNKKGKWEWDYNVQTIVDEYKIIILSSYITQNPTDHFELIPSIEQLKTNLDGIYEELPSNFQFSPDNGYSTDENTTCIEEKGLDGYISTRKLSRKEKSTIYGKNHFKKTISTIIQKLKAYICPLGEILYRRKTYEYKNKQRITYQTNKCKKYIMKEICCKKKNYRTIQDYENPSKIRM